MKRFIWRRHKWEIGVVVCVFLLLLINTVPHFIHAQRINHPGHFPDPVFLQIVQRFMQIAPGEPLTREQAKAFTRGFTILHRFNPRAQNPYGNTVQSIKGIEFFPSITFFNCIGHRLKTADLSHNPKLRALRLNHNQLQSLILPPNNALQSLYLGDNHLKALDLSPCRLLQVLIVSNNQLTTLDLLPTIRRVHAGHNQLTQISLSLADWLEYLNLSHNRLKSLPNLDHLTRLKYLDLSHNRLKTLPSFERLTRLQYLNLRGNPLSQVSPKTLNTLDERLALFVDKKRWQ